MNIQRKLIWAALFVLVPFVYVALLDLAGTRERLDNVFVDIRYRVANPGHRISDKIAIIDVDEESLQQLKDDELFGRWPWRRAAYTEVLDFALYRAQARAVLFDILFVERSFFQGPNAEFSDDEILASAGDYFPGIYHAINFRYDANAPRVPPPLPEPELLSKAWDVHVANEDIVPVFNRVAYPAGEIGHRVSGLQSVTFAPDPDGISRRIRPLFGVGEAGNRKFYPTLALAGLDAVHGVRDVTYTENNLTIQTQDGSALEHPLQDGQMRLHYYSEEELERIPRLGVFAFLASMSLIEQGVDDFSELAVDPTLLADRVVILGTSAAATHDTVTTPYGIAPGFMLHAILLSNLLEGHALHVLPGWLGYAMMIVLLPLTVACVLFFHNVVLRVILPVTVFLAVGLSAVVLFQYDIALPMAHVWLSMPPVFLASMALLSFTEGAEKRRYRRVLSNMVDPTIVGEALKDLEALKQGGEKEITAFFSDVAGFSTISEGLSSQALADLLNEYLSAMTLILKHHRGTLDKYIGDAVVGIFGAPIDQPEHFRDAARASLEMLERLEELKAYWKKNDLYIAEAQDMQVRIGLNTGTAKVGFMGTDDLASYTMMGDTVNLAARLEAAGKDYGVSCLISESTNALIKDEMLTRLLDAVVVKGKTKPVRIYELIGGRSTVTDQAVEAAAKFEAGFALYLQRDWDGAVRTLAEAERLRGQGPDRAVAMLVERCEFYRSAPPAEGWDGAFVRTHK